MKTTDLATHLKEHKGEIVTRFVDEVQRGALAPSGTERLLLVDHIPYFIDDIVAELDRDAPVHSRQDANDTSETARQHGVQRWTLGYDLDGLIREYGVLRHTIVVTCKEQGVAISIDELETVAKCITVGIAEAAAEYGRFRSAQLDEQKATLDFVTEAGQLLTSSLDYRSTLSRLMALLVPRMADWCALYIEGSDAGEMPVAHADPAKAALLRELFRRYPVPKESEHGHHAVVRSGEPRLVSTIEPGYYETVATDPEQLAMLKEVGTCSWLIVPLRVQQTTFGALILAYSESRRTYGANDLLVASELARRAAVAIDNARLYELSQRERSRVEAATRAKDEFVAMLSHELRTPLNAILGWIRLMRSGTLDPAKREHALDVIERNADAQSTLVGDLLDISRVITGKLRIAPSQLDLGNVIEMAIEGVVPAANAKRIEITTDLEAGAPIVRGDSERLQQVVWNLLTNAVKFTPKNGRVRVRLLRVESDVELTVEDNGQGIAPEFLPHVFESFRQQDGTATRAHGGLGIGLSIAKHIVELHGGSILAASPGKALGATFTVRLPISPLISSTLGVSRVPATSEPVANAALPRGLEGLRVLVVDDEPDARELLAYVLESCGIEVVIASSVAEALGELARTTPDVIVSDIGMPEEDGYFFIRTVRTLADEEKRSVPVIALTAFARSEDRTRALVEGFNLHMTKPVEPTALVQAVADLAGPDSR